MKHTSFVRGTAILWLGLVLFFVCSIALLLPIRPNDYWWYIRLGGEIVETRVVPTVDTFTYTRYGQPMVYHSWLSAVLFWGIHQLGGTTLTVLARGALLAIFYALTWYACRLAGAGTRLSAILTLLAALAGSNNWAMRPQLFSYPLFALTLVSLCQWRRGHSKWLWLLPPTVALWANLHGAFVLPFLLAGAALVGGGGNRRALLMALGGMFAASLLNPRGVGDWEYVLSLLTDPASQQLGVEWKPPTSDTWQGALFFAWLLFFPLLTAFSEKRLSLTDWLWFLGFGWMALSGLRYVIWALAILAPLSAALLVSLVGRRLDRMTVRGIPLLNGAIVLLLLLMLLALLPGLRERWWHQSPPVLSSNTPVEAVAWLATHPELAGNLWSDLAFSSYLIYALPERPVWIDTRFELYPLDNWQKYEEIAQAAPGLSGLLAEDNINLLLIDPAAQPRLLVALQESPAWCPRYRDKAAAIFIRCGHGPGGL